MKFDIFIEDFKIIFDIYNWGILQTVSLVGVTLYSSPKLIFLPEDVTMRQRPGSLAVATDGMVRTIKPDMMGINLLFKRCIVLVVK